MFPSDIEFQKTVVTLLVLIAVLLAISLPVLAVGIIKAEQNTGRTAEIVRQQQNR